MLIAVAAVRQWHLGCPSRLGVAVARERLMTHVWRPVRASRHCDGDRQARICSIFASLRVLVRVRRRSGVGLAFVIELSAIVAPERKGGRRVIDNREYDV